MAQEPLRGRIKIVIDVEAGETMFGKDTVNAEKFLLSQGGEDAHAMQVKWL
jgi:hypothetical protein